MDPICANCGIQIRWQPTVADGETYCCVGCAMGGPCTCDYSNLPRLGEVRALVHARRVIILPGSSRTAKKPKAVQAETDDSANIPPHERDWRRDPRECLDR